LLLDKDVHPSELVTVSVYVEPPVKPVNVAVVPEPFNIPDGLPVTVQFPELGNPLKATLPVGLEHVGCVIVPTTGAVGKAFI
jgi:hypothetical protein